jgi:hypothetical protein
MQMLKSLAEVGLRYVPDRPSQPYAEEDKELCFATSYHLFVN